MRFPGNRQTSPQAAVQGSAEIAALVCRRRARTLQRFWGFHRREVRRCWRPTRSRRRQVRRRTDHFPHIAENSQRDADFRVGTHKGCCSHNSRSRGYRNVLVEIDNECNVRYEHAILQPERVHELIERVKKITRNGRSLLVTTSYGGGTIPKQNVVRVADFLLIHGNDNPIQKGFRRWSVRSTLCRAIEEFQSCSTKTTIMTSKSR